jgi:hypothetical protein
MAINIRALGANDLPALQAAIDRDKLHPGEWKVEHFYDQPAIENLYQAPVYTQVIENQNGPIAFVRYTKTLRISCVWNDAEDYSRNAKAVILGLANAVKLARGDGYSEIVITTSHPKLADFLTKVMKLTKSDSEYLLQL